MDVRYVLEKAMPTKDMWLGNWSVHEYGWIYRLRIARYLSELSFYLAIVLCLKEFCMSAHHLLKLEAQRGTITSTYGGRTTWEIRRITKASFDRFQQIDSDCPSLMKATSNLIQKTDYSS